MITTKRNSLEKFIREQMEGPGACNYEFYCNDDQDTIDCKEELINTTPGSVYTTAILFPKRNQSQDSDVDGDATDKTEPDVNDEFADSNDDDANDTLDDLTDNVTDDGDEADSISQRFPNTIGLSCCIDKDGKPICSSDIKITVSGRYYTKLSTSECTSVVIKVQNINEFTVFYNTYKSELEPYFVLVEGGVSLTSDISRHVSEVKDLLLSINKQLCNRIARNSAGTLDPEYILIGENYRYLKSYKERLWRKLKSSAELNLHVDERADVESKLKEIEKYERALSYLKDAMDICNSRSYGFWRSHSFAEEIHLGSVDFNAPGKKIIYSPAKHKELNVALYECQEDDLDVTLSFAVWLQITRSLHDGSSRKYLKVQVENTSTPFVEDGKNYFSIVTEKVNRRSIFGITIRVDSELLSPYQEHTDNIQQNDVKELNYLYRSIKDYAVGHSCSVDWKVDDSEQWVKTEFIPAYETPDVEAVPRDKYDYKFNEASGKYLPVELLPNTHALEFKWLSTLSDATDDEIIAGLNAFVDSYQSWITKQRQMLVSSTEDHHIGHANLDMCQADCDRMKANIGLILEGNPVAMESFRLMNTAMFIQLWHSKNHTDKETTYDFYRDSADDKLFGDAPAAWRPFQLAFILLNLDGIIQRHDDINWEARNENVDLVWFPTGGGKTEAYLGIIAFAIIVRRKLYDQRNGGTAAIMRYTLRLLATQQFQRAMRLIFALEQLRSWDMYDLGNEEISIGLYVGDNSLPNKAGGDDGLLAECRKWSTIGRDGRRKESKIPLDICPCCGEQIEYQNLGSERAPQIIFRCANPECAFAKKLPVVLCDEDIYANPPTLLFGTVDKFAMLGHKVSDVPNTDSRRLFGKGTADQMPPSLIIQDELHLLLGPLGSAVSLFESAIDCLCTYTTPEGLEVRPKIISSTATTRNTEFQIRALYDRDVRIFPKSGVDYDDSYFAFYKREKVDEKINFISKRKYIGILPTGRTQMTTQMRLVATIFVHRALFEQEYASRLSDPEVELAMDYYHSVVDYFNSLKEVGKTDAQFYTEFTKYTRRLFGRVLRSSHCLECLYCYDTSFSKSELTGRLSGAEVVKELENVGKHWKAEQRVPYRSADGTTWVRGFTPPDLILATNMISVGLDVDRFNTIIMNSMPRNIAEYIQASSRVARNKSGLVITLHNPFRARDISHFERFREFHEKLYYFVEPISITPFSKKSVDKYMPLFVATMIRHSIPELSKAQDASGLNLRLQGEIKTKLFGYFQNRLSRTRGLEPGQRELLTDELEAYIERFIEDAIEYWQKLVDGQTIENYQLRYSGAEFLRQMGRDGYKDLFLAIDAYQDEATSNLWLVPMSLRNVESEAVIKVNDN